MSNFKVGLKKLFKSSDRSSNSVKEILKSMKLEDALAEDKKKESIDDMERGRNWFHPHTKRSLAEQKLVDAGNKTGMFLVRASANSGNFVLSLVAGRERCHYNVNQVAPGSYTIGDVGSCVYRGIDQVVDEYKTDTKRLKARLVTPCPGKPPPYENSAFGYTNILHRAIKEGDQDSTLKILANDNCPDVNAKNEQGNTALHEACLSGEATIVDHLLDHGAKTNIPQLDGLTALMLCCVKNSPDIVEILIKKGGADPQDTDVNTGNVALHKAAELGRLECIKVLLSLRAPLYTRNNNSKLAEELAQMNGHTDCAKYIKEFKPFPAETSKEEWFHGTLTKTEAENIIKRHGWTDGLFIIRKSATRQNLYILVLGYESYIYNYEIKNKENRIFCIDDGTVLPSLEHLVEFYCIRAEGLPCRLVKAVGPDDKIRSMKWTNGRRDRSRSGVPNLDATYQSAMNNRLTAEPHILESKKVKLGPELGEGEYGSVYRGWWTTEKNEVVPVAVKTFHAKHASASARQNFMREAELMVKLNHPCVVRLIGVCLEPNLMLVQELVDYGSMLDYMLDYHERINTTSDLYLWAAQIACGMTYLEDNHIVHRDLAARNILLKDKKQAKVGDFGLSRGTSETTDAYQASVGGRWPIKWYAPECVNFGTFSSKSDVWSYGITLWEMFTLGDQPYGEKTGGEVISMVERGGRLKRPPACPEKVYSLMQQCWKYEAADRPTFSKLQEHFDTDPEYMCIRALIQLEGSNPSDHSQI